MITTTSCNKGRFFHVLKSLLKRNRSLMVLWFALGFFCLPFQYGMTAFRMRDYGQGLQYIRLRTYGGGGLYTEFSLVTICMLWIVAAAVMAMVQTSYMQNRRAVDLYHSLPLTRPQLLGANYLAAFVTVALPMAVNYLMTMVLAEIRQQLAPQELGMDLYSFGYYTEFGWGGALFSLVTWLVALGGMLSVAFFLATQAGSVFDTLVFCGVILLAPAGMVLINCLLCEMFLYGYVFNMDMGVVLALSPVTLGLTDIFQTLFGVEEAQPGKGSVLVWLVLDILIFAGAAAAYRRRPSERAESPSRSGPVSVLVRLLTLLFACPVLGVVFSYGVTQTESVFHILMGTVITSVLIFGVMETILNRGARGILKSAPLCLVLTLAVAGYTGIMASGGLGYETYQPALEKVDYLTIDYRGRFDDVQFYPVSTENISVYENDYKQQETRYYYSRQGTVDLTQKETLALAQELQATIVRQYREERSQKGEASASVVEADRNKYNYKQSHTTIGFDYTLEDGSQVHRFYNARLTPEVMELVGKLAVCEEMNSKCNPLENTSDQDYTDITVSGWMGLEEKTFTDQQSKEMLLEALRKDVEQESWNEYQNPDKEIVAQIRLVPAQERDPVDKPAERDFYGEYMLDVTSGYTNTLAAMKKLDCGELMEEKPENLAAAYVFPLDYFMGYESHMALLRTGWYSPEDRTMVAEWKKQEDTPLVILEKEETVQLAQLARYILPSGTNAMLIGIVFESDDGGVSVPMITTTTCLEENGMSELVYKMENDLY